MTKDDLLRFLPWLDKKGATSFTGVKYEEITDKGLTITTKERQKKTIKADTIVVTLPFLPSTNIIKTLEEEVPEIYEIGDCKEPRLMADAIADGARLGHTI